MDESDSFLLVGVGSNGIFEQSEQISANAGEGEGTSALLCSTLFYSLLLHSTAQFQAGKNIEPSREGKRKEERPIR